MAEAFQAVMTDAGRKLVGKVVAGGGVVFTRGCLGSGRLPAEADAAALAGMLEPVADAAIVCSGTGEDGTAVLSVQYTNDGLAKGFLASEVGIFARETDEGGNAAGDEVLYCYMTMGDGAEPVGAAPPVMTRVYDMPVSVGRLDGMRVEITPGVYATHGQLDAHAGSRQNPHAVTPGQIGLGKVDNTADSEKVVAAAASADTLRLAAQGDWSGCAQLRVVDIAGKTSAESALLLRSGTSGAAGAAEMVIPVLAVNAAGNSYTAAAYKNEMGSWYAKIFNSAGAAVGGGVSVSVRYLHVRPLQ